LPQTTDPGPRTGSQHVTVVGAGLSGALAAILLARRGFDITVFEKRPDPRRVEQDAGRSINLALADRGLAALEAAGLGDAVAPLLIPMVGRMLHGLDGDRQLVPYGQRPHEVIYSVSRPGLNRLLLDRLEQDHAVEVQFERSAVAADFDAGRLMLTAPDRSQIAHPLERVIAADGGGSPMRHSLVEYTGALSTEELLPHGYKELTLPADAQGRHQIDRHALHIWPRGGFMLIALPNLDGSFTVTLFLPHQGDQSFAALEKPADVERFFASHFPDALALMPQVAEEFFEHPTGYMGTIRCERWAVRDQMLLIGDAAHAIVPFHGQGMNCAFEDCAELDALLAEGRDFGRVFQEFEARRKPNADAIADMALENYVEMRDTVRDPRFQLGKELAFELERRCPDRFIPRYSMVMFHYEIPYAVARQRGSIQAKILEEFTAGASTLDDIDLDAAQARVHERLTPIEAPRA
jgi:kynurenine 3-monooxygenase